MSLSNAFTMALLFLSLAASIHFGFVPLSIESIVIYGITVSVVSWVYYVLEKRKEHNGKLDHRNRQI